MSTPKNPQQALQDATTYLQSHRAALLQMLVDRGVIQTADDRWHLQVDRLQNLHSARPTTARHCGCRRGAPGARPK